MQVNYNMTVERVNEYWQNNLRDTSECLTIALASIILKSPIPISYETWKGLHLIIGDE